MERARQAEEAWRIEEEKREAKRKEVALELERDNEEFKKKFSKAVPDRVILLDDDEEDEEDKIRRLRLLEKFKCMVPTKGSLAMDMFGAIHAPTIVESLVKQESGPNDARAGGPTLDNSRTTSSQMQSLYKQMLSADVKEELLQSLYHLKRKTVMEAAIDEKLETCFDVVLDSHFNKRIRVVISDGHGPNLADRTVRPS